MKENDEVLVIDGYPYEKGVIEKVSTWGEVLGKTKDNSPCYFVRVPAWDKGTNGGRWLDASSVKEIQHD